MKTATATLQGVSPYSQSRIFIEPRQRDEDHDMFRQRTWRMHMHVKDGQVFIPPTAIKNCLDEAAKHLGIQVPGRGKKTYTKSFESGVLCVDPLMMFKGQPPTPIRADEVQSETLFLNADGKRGGNVRVWKTYPYIGEGWTAKATFHIIDEALLNKHSDECTVFEYVLRQAGGFVGLGRFRPFMRGFYGRFEVADFKIS